MKLKLRENADINVVTGISDIIIDSINKKWDNIRDLNSIIVNLNEEGYEDIVPVIQSVLEDENKNVGKLQQLVELISPTAKSIDDGRQEAIDELDNTEEVKVEEEMKLDENFSNVPENTQTNVDPTFGKAIEDKKEDEKVIEDALKENEKLAKETIPKEGETGKKVTSKALKAMHLSESLFDNEGSSVNFNIGDRVQVHFEDSPDKIGEVRDIIGDDVIEVEEFDSTGSPYRIDRYYKQQLTKLDESLLYEDLSQGEQMSFNSDVFHALEEVAFKWRDKNVSPDAWTKALEWFEWQFIETGEWDLTEDFKSKKNVLEKKLANFLINKEFENKFKISNDDKREFISKALNLISKHYAKNENITGEDIADLVNSLFKMSFNKDGNLMTEDKNVSIKYDIAKEQLNRFKEGKMPKDWQPKDYINDLVKKNHLTKEEGKNLLSEV